MIIQIPFKDGSVKIEVAWNFQFRYKFWIDRSLLLFSMAQ